MRPIALVITLLAELAGCSQILGLHDVTVEPYVGGQVRGLWDGADGVALQLHTDGADTLLTVSANGAFRFPEQFAPGASYTVTVASNPIQHTCVVDRGGNGMVGGIDVVNISIACTGPAAIALSGQWGWTFDATQEIQMFQGSIVAQNVAMTISGSSLSSANVNGVTATLGKETVPIALPLGLTTVPVVLTAGGGLSKTYQFVFDRGGLVLNQLAYGKASNPGANDGFGFSAALSGDTLVVGATGEASAATGINGNQADNSAAGAGAVYVFARNGTTWMQQAYVKASNTGANDLFGWSVALSGDTLAVGAIGEASAAKGVNGNQADNTAVNSGAVYLFVRSGMMWTQQAYVKASNTEVGDSFGHSVALSGDTLVVGASNEDSSATGVNGNQADNTAGDSGAVYVFVRNGATWTQQAYLKASNTGANDFFGASVALSGDTLAVGAEREASATTGINGPQTDNSAPSAGAAYVFVRTGTIWAQQAYIKASNTGANDEFGGRVALSVDTLAVSAGREDSAATGVNGNETDNSVDGAGAVYVFVRSGTTWVQQAYVKASNPGVSDGFGAWVAVAGDTLAVAASDEGSAATGINGNQADNSAAGAGAVYVFTRSGTTWTQQVYVKASNTAPNEFFGYPVALSGDTLVVGGGNDASSATGVNGNQADKSVIGAGAFYVFR